MFHSRKLHNKINKLHERSLRIVYNNDTSRSEELLSKDKSVTIHSSNIQTLSIEMYKGKYNLSLPITQDIFNIRNTLPNMRIQHDSTLPQSKTVNYGTESITFTGPKVWNILPKSYKEAQTLNKFKLDSKHWIPSNCPSKLYKRYHINTTFKMWGL